MSGGCKHRVIDKAYKRWSDFDKICWNAAQAMTAPYDKENTKSLSNQDSQPISSVHELFNEFLSIIFYRNLLALVFHLDQAKKELKDSMTWL